MVDFFFIRIILIFLDFHNIVIVVSRLDMSANFLQISLPNYLQALRQWQAPEILSASR